MKNQALIIISSANELPLNNPTKQKIDTGFFLVEMGKILDTFKDDYEFIFATPNGEKPTLDINGESLSMQAGEKLGIASVKEKFYKDPTNYRQKNTKLVDRREKELNTLYDLLGKLPVSQNLSNTDEETKEFRKQIVRKMDDLEEKKFYSLKELLENNADNNNDFSFENLSFVHLPGGHAPMVDFLDNPELGEVLNQLSEQKVITSLICHAPIALTSARLRIDDKGKPYNYDKSLYEGAHITTVPKIGELFMLISGYPKIKNKKTRLHYYVDKKLISYNFNVKTTKNFTKSLVVYDKTRKLLTGNGPQAIDDQTDKLKEILPK
ncbi:type 1 glutamine amidotransferase domain-containing protein [Staphylococcus xylosus]|uniref:type 1 glutamine amidotransferase domain-containing protein n=4 Tax=Staphylococcus TaxID=1279 RepID=UPI000E69EFD3|nr:type 1 glutamine amidotransferase domain-containing protein [Staphylococcus xylosus]RIM63498.1 hypothetical protein BU122_13320 [Staphylococcus xylosus]